MGHFYSTLDYAHWLFGLLAILGLSSTKDSNIRRKLSSVRKLTELFICLEYYNMIELMIKASLELEVIKLSNTQWAKLVEVIKNVNSTPIKRFKTENKSMQY